MGERCREMLGTGSQTFTPAALVISRRWSTWTAIDRANRKLIDRLIALGPDEAQREWAMRMILVSRCLERIGDHAVDIGEQTAYLVRGRFEEFTDASHKKSPK